MMSIIARPGLTHTEYYDQDRDCWTGHRHRATQYSADEAVNILTVLDELGSYVLED